jgi:hypothetical protein
MNTNLRRHLNIALTLLAINHLDRVNDSLHVDTGSLDIFGRKIQDSILIHSGHSFSL